MKYLIIALVLLTACSDRITVPPINGKDGAPGAAGRDGSNGTDGSNGRDGTTVTVVQFCPGYTPRYGLWPEVGFCIGGKLYAEWYSPPSSGLVLLSPGSYASTQTGAPCSFTVNANCVLTY